MLYWGICIFTYRITILSKYVHTLVDKIVIEIFFYIYHAICLSLCLLHTIFLYCYMSITCFLSIVLFYSYHIYWLLNYLWELFNISYCFFLPIYLGVLLFIYMCSLSVRSLWVLRSGSIPWLSIGFKIFH